MRLVRLGQDLALWVFFTLALAVVIPFVPLIAVVGLVFDEDDFRKDKA